MVILGLALPGVWHRGAVARLDAQKRLQIGLLPGLLRAVDVLLTVRLRLPRKVVRLLLMGKPLRCSLALIPLLRCLHILQSSDTMDAVHCMGADKR